MHRGYIKIWRKVEDSGLLQMHGTLALFIIMLMKAAYKPCRFGLIDLERGQFSAGRFQLSEWSGLSEQSVRTSLKHLHDLDMVTSKPTNKFTVYTIVNYGQYQDCDDTTNQQTNQQLTNNQPTTNQQLTTNKELKHLSIKELNTNTPRISSLNKLISFGVNEQIAKDWLLIRKAKKLPLTDTALNQIKKEAESIGKTLPDIIEVCAKNNWGSFKASWQIPNDAGTSKKYDPDEFLKRMGAK